MELKKLVKGWKPIRTATLTTGGLGFLSAAAWTVHLALGLAAVGISLLVLEWLSED